MADGKDTYVALPDGRYVHVPGNATPEQLNALREKLRGTQQTPSTLKQVGREAALGAASGAGIPETTTPIQDLLKNVKETLATQLVRPLTHPGLQSAKASLLANPAVTVPKALVGTTQEAGKAAGLRNVNIGPGVDIPFATGVFDLPKLAHDVSSLVTQIAMLGGGKKAAGTPINKSEVLGGARTAIRESMDVAEKDISKARGEVQARNIAKTGTFQSEANLAKARSRAEYEGAAAERERQAARERAEFEKESKQASATARGKYEQAEADVQKESTARQKGYEKEVEANRFRQTLERERDNTAKQLAQNLNQAEAAERTELDRRYADLDRQILGVTPQNPNGTLNSNLSTIGDAVQYARTNIIKGSQTSVPIFNSILGRLKDMVELPDGTVRPLEGQMIPTSQLRGYVRELGSAIYESSIPGDVREALKHVEEQSKNEVARTIEDVHGKAAEQIYQQLSNDWSNYKRVWFDRSLNHPLGRIRSIMRDPSVEKSNLSVYQQIAKTIKGEKGQNAATLLGEKSRFGANPKLAQKLMTLDEQIGKLPKAKEPTPPEPVEPPNVAKIRIPKPPGAPEEPSYAKFTAPTPPSLETFDPERFVRDTIAGKAKTIERWGIAGAIAWTIRDVLHGKSPSLPLLATPIAQKFLTKALQSQRMVDWLMQDIDKRKTQ